MTTFPRALVVAERQEPLWAGAKLVLIRPKAVTRTPPQYGNTPPPAALLVLVACSTSTFQGTFSAQEEVPPITFREIFFGQESTNLLPQIASRLMSAPCT